MNPSEIRAELLPRAIPGAILHLVFGIDRRRRLEGGGWPNLGAAGPGSAVVALLLCGLLTALVGSCYAEMVQLRPAAGGEMGYAHELLGTGAGFAACWALVLIAISSACSRRYRSGR